MSLPAWKAAAAASSQPRIGAEPHPNGGQSASREDLNDPYLERAMPNSFARRGYTNLMKSKYLLPILANLVAKK